MNAVPKPDCPVHQACGGCGLMPLDWSQQRQRKYRDFVQLWCAARLPPLALPRALTTAGAWLGYRNRVRCQIADAQVRFYNRNKARECRVLEASVLEGIEVARDLVQRNPRQTAGFSQLEVRARDVLGRGALVFGGAPGQLSEVEAPSDWLLGVRGEASPACQRWQVTRSTWVQIPVDAFMQINTLVNRLLVERVVGTLQEYGARSFIDLYMGAGNFAVPLLAAGLEGRGVERHPAAVRAAETAASQQQLGFREVVAGDALTQCSQWQASGISADAVICDPPRAGMRPSTALAASLARQLIVMCSCNPHSLCRDLAELSTLGFQIQRVELFDMFPQTSHVEVVVWLERG